MINLRGDRRLRFEIQNFHLQNHFIYSFYLVYSNRLNFILKLIFHHHRHSHVCCHIHIHHNQHHHNIKLLSVGSIVYMFIT
jgi:hypothetical protein